MSNPTQEQIANAMVVGMVLEDAARQWCHWCDEDNDLGHRLTCNDPAR